MAPGRLALIATLTALALMLLTPAVASAHAVLVGASPADRARLSTSPSQVTLRFSEAVQLLKPADMSVVDAKGVPVTRGSGGEVDPQNHRALQAALKPGLPNGTYTIRWLVVSADSHIVGGAIAFGVGPGRVGAPFLGGAIGAGGPKETGVWAVSARFFELVGLGGLLGLLAFRWLVWRPSVRASRGFAPEELEASLAWGRDMFWFGFGSLAVGAMVAEGYLLVVKSASALGVTVWDTLRDPSSISQVLGDTRFGSLLQLRGALLFALFAIGIWQFLADYGSERSPRAATAAGRAVPAAIMTALIVVVLGALSSQGHASQAPLSRLQVAADAAHLDSVAIWIAGLALVGLCFLTLPRVAPVGGPSLAASVLARFSLVATAAVSVAILTGVIRAVGELSAPSQLWDTAYGRSILYKLLLLCPIAFLAFRNRRVVVAFETVKRPSGAALRMVRRNVALELGLALAVVVVASVLVAQVPGRV
jgi:copper transport protein